MSSASPSSRARTASLAQPADGPVEVQVPDEDLPARIAEVGRDLAYFLQQILDALPGRPSRPNDLAACLGLNRDIAGRVLRATAESEPLEAVHIAPGPEPLRRFIRAAARKGVPADLTDAALAAIDRFDQLIREAAGTRSALNAIIGASLPDARERFEFASRQSVFKGMSQLRGVQAECWLSSTVVHPSATDAARHDVIMLHGALAMRRLRPDATVKFTYRDTVSAPGDGSEREGARRASEALAPFCTNPPADLETRRVGQVTHHILRNSAVGPDAAVDMLAVDHHPSAWARYVEDNPAEPGRTQRSLFVAPGVPAQTLLFDAILHEDVFPGSEPALVVYDTTTDGIAHINDPTRDLDRVPMNEPIQFMGRGVMRLHAAEAPRYPAMLAHLFGQHGCDPARYRAYRFRMQYPVIGWQICMAFDPPRAPDRATTP